MASVINIPVREIGPLKIIGQFDMTVKVPLATYEKPLWPSVSRGAKISCRTNGIISNVISECMTRSIILEGTSSQHALELQQELQNKKSILQQEVEQTGRFVKLSDMHFQIIANLIYIRFEFFTGDASGHNMVTKACDKLIRWICKECPSYKYVSISGNYCVDKKVSAVNGILGRGKNVISEINVSREICQELLKTTPDQIVELNIKKNLLGSILSGSLRSGNAHYANMLLAIYLATGQDAANIVEGSQGITYAKINSDGGLYFSINCPNIIVGSIGNGKEYEFAKEYLHNMGCLEQDAAVGENARKLACIIGATVLCGELSLLAAQTNQGELMRAHEIIERRKSS